MGSQGCAEQAGAAATDDIYLSFKAESGVPLRMPSFVITAIVSKAFFHDLVAEVSDIGSGTISGKIEVQCVCEIHTRGTPPLVMVGGVTFR
jgi:hypothetical protein